MQPPTRKRRLFTQSPVILRFFRTSFRRLKCSMRHTKVAWWLSAELAFSALLPALAIGPGILLGACMVRAPLALQANRLLNAAHKGGLVAIRGAGAGRLAACFGRRPWNPPGRLHI